MKQIMTERWNDDSSYSILLGDKEIIRGEYDQVDTKMMKISEILGTTLGFGGGLGVAQLAITFSPFFLLLIPTGVLAILCFLTGTKKNEK